MWVAGNVTDLTAQVGAAAAAGAMAGAHINADLVTEETRDAVLAHRDAFTADGSPPTCSPPRPRPGCASRWRATAATGCDGRSRQAQASGVPWGAGVSRRRGRRRQALP